MKYLLILLLFACSCGHKIHSGTVTEIWYEPARTYTYTTTVMIGKIPMIQTHTGYDDEDFIITVKGVYKGKERSENFYLNRSDWEEMKIGSCFNDTIPCWREDPNNK